MKHLIMGTAGHVDHGKTSLVKALTNIDCDTHKEEKKRGITINLGFAYLNLPGGESIGIIDVPGHKNFINTMVSGAYGIDFVLLVIAADSGIMPQTVEHVNIISALGINKGIVALTKSDLVDNELIEMAKLEISEFLDKTSLKDSPIVAVSSLTGEGKEELINAIENTIRNVEEKETGDLFRLYIDRIFNIKGFGSVVTGSVLGGSIETGKDVFLLPGNYNKLRLRAIERHGKAVEKAVAGDRAAFNLIGLKHEDFKRGMIISDKNLKETQMIDACIFVFDKEVSLPVWSSVTFHSGTFECPARMHALNKDTIKTEEESIVQIHLDNTAVLINKDKFIFRNSSGDRTLGSGYIIDASPLHHRKRTSTLIENLTHLSETILKKQSIHSMIGIELKKEFKPYSIEEIAEKLNTKAQLLKEEIKKEAIGFQVFHVNESAIIIDKGYHNLYKSKALKTLAGYHAEYPLFSGGLETNEMTGKLGLSKLNTGKIYLDMLLKELQADGKIEKYNATWILKGHTARFDKQAKEEIKWFENEIVKYGIVKPVMSELEEKALDRKIQKGKLKMYMTVLANEGKICFFQNDFLHMDIVNKFRPVLLQELLKKNGVLQMTEFRTTINATKRFCSVLLGIYEAEKIISTTGEGEETTIFISEKEKNK